MANTHQNNQAGGELGSAVTAANSGGASGTPYTHVIPGTAGAIQYVERSGRKAILLDYGSTSGYVRFDDTSSPTEPRRRAGVRFWLPDALVGATATLIMIYAEGGATFGGVELTSAKKLRAIRSSFAPITGSESPVLPAGEYWVEAAVTRGVGTTGRVEYTLHKAGTTTPIATFDSGATVATQDAVPAHTRWGVNTASNVESLTIADTRSSSTAAGGGWTGPIEGAVIIASAGPDQFDIEPLSTVTLTATANTAVTTWAWTQTAGPAVTLSGTGATRTFTAPATQAGTTLTFSVTADASPADTVDVEVLPHDVWVVQSGALVAARFLAPSEL